MENSASYVIYEGYLNDKMYPWLEYVCSYYCNDKWTHLVQEVPDQFLKNYVVPNSHLNLDESLQEFYLQNPFIEVSADKCSRIAETLSDIKELNKRYREVRNKY